MIRLKCGQALHFFAFKTYAIMTHSYFEYIVYQGADRRYAPRQVRRDNMKPIWIIIGGENMGSVD